MKINKKGVCVAILLVYIGVLFFVTVLSRVPSAKNSIQTEWFWGYKVDDPNIRYGDNLVNLLLYIPIGCLAGIIAPKHKLLTAMLVGFFLSETVECSQLIWHRGVFDVDDLFNNTLGAFVGGLIVVLTIGIRNKTTKKEIKQ